MEGRVGFAEFAVCLNLRRGRCDAWVVREAGTLRLLAFALARSDVRLGEAFADSAGRIQKRGAGRVLCVIPAEKAVGELRQEAGFVQAPPAVSGVPSCLHSKRG